MCRTARDVFCERARRPVSPCRRHSVVPVAPEAQSRHATQLNPRTDRTRRFRLAMTSDTQSDFIELESLIDILLDEEYDGHVWECEQSYFFDDYDVFADEEVILEAVEQNGNSLTYASDELKAKKEVVLVAVNNDGDALQYAAGDLASDVDVVLAAVACKGTSIQYASDEIRSDKNMVAYAIKQDGYAFEHALGEAQSDWDLLTRAVDRICSCSSHDALSADQHHILTWLQRKDFPDICRRLITIRTGHPAFVWINMEAFLREEVMVHPSRKMLIAIEILARNTTNDSSVVCIIKQYLERWQEVICTPKGKAAESVDALVFAMEACS